MQPRAYYNEIEPYAAAWLRRLIAEGLIPAGDVDERDIRDVRPSDLRGYTQCHFFAGLGGWAFALRLAGWPDDRPVWTGSCPCQPFSAAGRGGGFADERHLWPHWFHLIRECGPAVVFGEQVASKDGLLWFDLVSADMEGAGYAIGHADACAAGIGAPHIRQRLWFVASSGVGHHHHSGLPARECEALVGEGRRSEGRAALQPGRPSGGLADDDSARRHRGEVARLSQRRESPSSEAATERGADGAPWHDADGRGEPVGVADADVPERGRGEQRLHSESGTRLRGPRRTERGEDSAVYSGRTGPLHGFWSLADWLLCRDGKWRPVEPGTQPLAHGVSGRVVVARPGWASEAEPQRLVSRTGTLRAFGNAIVPQVAQAFIEAYCDTRGLAAPRVAGSIVPFEEPLPVNLVEAIAHIEAKGYRLWHLGRSTTGEWSARLYNTRHTRLGEGGDAFSPACKSDDAAKAILGCLQGPMTPDLFDGRVIRDDGVSAAVWERFEAARADLTKAMRR